MKQIQEITLHKLLFQLVEQFGDEVLCENRLKGLISDLGGGDSRKFENVILCSIRDHIGYKLLQLRNLDNADFSLRVNNIKQSFQEENFLTPGIADYIIDSYTYALGWIDNLADFNFEEAQNNSNVPAGQLNFIETENGDYCGNFNKDGDRSGFGILKKEDSSYYAGEWKLNQRYGIGFSFDSQRHCYAGQWRLNKRNGVGITEEDGTRIAGEWKNGKLNGPAIIFLPGGERISARFINDTICDENGIFYLKDNTYVVGKMSESGPTGKCCHFIQAGDFVEELWEEGRFIKTI